VDQLHQVLVAVPLAIGPLPGVGRNPEHVMQDAPHPLPVIRLPECAVKPSQSISASSPRAPGSASALSPRVTGTGRTPPPLATLAEVACLPVSWHAFFCACAVAVSRAGATTGCTGGDSIPPRYWTGTRGESSAPSQLGDLCSSGERMPSISPFTAFQKLETPSMARQA